MKRYAMRSELSRPEPARVAGVAISNPERPIVEAPGHAKLDVVRYHEALTPWLLRELAPRPIAVVKCMDGRFDDCFFQKHPLRSRADEEESPPFMRLADIADVVRAVQNGAYEFHTWSASFPRLERPDRIVLDLDPDHRRCHGRRFARRPSTSARSSIASSFAGSSRLPAARACTSSCRSRAGIPGSRRSAFARRHRRRAGRRSSRACSSRRPARTRASGRVFVDYLRNADGATAVAAYSLRARPELPVSMPIDWSELATDVRGAHFNIDNAATAVARRGVDPWADYERSRQTLSASMRRAVHA